MPLCGREVLPERFCSDRRGEPQPVNIVLRLCNDRSTVDESPLSGKIADVDVLRDGKVLQDLWFLVNDPDASSDCRGRRGESRRCSIDGHLAARRSMFAAEDFQERGLACAVFSHYRQHFASIGI